MPQVDEVLSRAVEEQISEQRALREALESLDRRLAELEARYVALEERIGPLPDVLTEVTAELVSVLRRELVRIPDVLSDQRSAIAADLRAALARAAADATPEAIPDTIPDATVPSPPRAHE